MNRKFPVTHFDIITQAQAVTLLWGLRDSGKVFGVRFRKRTTGEDRHMTARFGVRKGVKGVGMAYTPTERTLLNAFDMRKGEYRMINVTGIYEISVEGRRYQVVP